MKKLTFILVSLIISAFAFSQSSPQDIVYPIDGSDPLMNCKIEDIKQGNIIYFTQNGVERRMEAVAIKRNGEYIDLSEYVMVDYINRSGKSINFYVAYYETQSKGRSIHSPATCLPGSGWDFRQSGTVPIPGVFSANGAMRVNRAVMQLGSQYQISYYWFPQRGRVLTNAYQLKLFVFWDSLTKQRTDGALVRLVTQVYADEKIEEAEERLQKFVRDIVPVLEEYIPGMELHYSS
jgi:EpsI family protein